jgi:hypothetical protein
MILLDSTQILSAVRRSLQTHVLPMLDDEFARIQIAASLKALEEVGDRLQNGDPCDRMNSDLVAGARAISAEYAESSPSFCARLRAALDSVPDDAGARDRNRALGEALWQLVEAGDGDPAARAVLRLLYDQALAAYSADGQYISIEAIVSLT